MARFTLGSALFGAAAMYLFDPDRGKRRRALVRDQFVKAACNVRDVFDAASRDFVNRGAGLVGETRSLLNRDAPIDDVLVERVRAKIGRYTQHPGAIEVGATSRRSHADGVNTRRGTPTSVGCGARRPRS